MAIRPRLVVWRLVGAVAEAKRVLGERGPVWWSDGAPDFNRKMVRNTLYDYARRKTLYEHQAWART